MVLIKEIELELSQKNDNVPEAIEDTLIKDSVIDLANVDFSKIDNIEDVTVGEIRKKIIVDSGYSGKPISRKKFSKSILKGDSIVQKQVANEDDFEVSSEGTSSDVMEENKSDNEGPAMDDSDVQSDKSEISLERESEEEEEHSEIQKDIQQNEIQKNDINIFSEKTTDAEVEKGMSIKNQLNIWETLLEGRIKLQPSLIAANKLYQKDDFINFKSLLKAEDETVLSDTYSSLGNLMKILLELQEVLLNSSQEYLKLRCTKDENSETKKEISDDESICSSLASGKEDENSENDEPDKNSSLGEPATKKRKLKNRSDHLDEIYTDFIPFKDKIIQTWNDKTKITSGKVNSTGYSAYDLTTLKQIEQILLDKKRLIRKTQLKRSDYIILGKEQNEENQPEDDTGKDNDRTQKEYYSEIFDDDDFYHKLLRDFIERKSTDGTDSIKHGRQWLEIQQLRSKMKRKVDTRCTKGRKLRYTVHNKLVNFMAPIPCNMWNEEAETQLFKSLFGKATQHLA